MKSFSKSKSSLAFSVLSTFVFLVCTAVFPHVFAVRYIYYHSLYMYHTPVHQGLLRLHIIIHPRKKLVITAFIFQPLLETWPSSLLLHKLCFTFLIPVTHLTQILFFCQKLSKHFPKVRISSSVWILMGNKVTENTQTNTQPALMGKGCHWGSH